MSSNNKYLRNIDKYLSYKGRNSHFIPTLSIKVQI